MADGKVIIDVNVKDSDLDKANKKLKEYADKAKKAGEETEGLGKSSDDAGKEADKTASKFSKMLDSISDMKIPIISQAITKIKDLKNNTNESSGKFKNLALAMGAVQIGISAISSAISYVKDLSTEAMNASDAMDKFQSTMQFAGIDTKEIAEAKKQLKEYADLTVYDNADTFNTASQLAANGIKDYLELTKAAGNLNAVAGGNKETFKSVAMVLTQTAGAGKLTTENWNQLADAIPGASGKLQEAMLKNGAYTGNFRDAMSEGQITAEEFNQALKQLGLSDVASKAAQSTSTFQGAFGVLESNVINGINQIIDAFGKENLVNIINTASDSIATTFTKVADAIKNTIKFVKDINDKYTFLAPVLKSVAIALTSMFTALLAIGGTVSIIKAVVSAFSLLTANPLVLIIGAIVGLVSMLTNLWQTNETFRNSVLSAWDSICNFFTKTVPKTFDTVKQAVVDFVLNAKDKLLSFCDNVIQAISSLYDKIVNFFTVSIPNAFNTFVDFLSNIPYLVGYAIGLVIGFFINLPIQIWNAIKATIDFLVQWGSNIYNVMSDAVSTAIDAVISFFANLPTTIWNLLVSVVNYLVQWGINTYNTMSSWISNAVSAVISILSSLPSTIWDILVSAITSVVNWGSNLAKSGYDAAKQLFDKVIDTLRSLPDSVVGIGEDIAKGIWNGITSMADWLGNKVKSFTKGIVDGAKSALGIHSPSKVMADYVGKYIPMGVGVGIDKYSNVPVKSMSDMSAKLKRFNQSNLTDMLGYSGRLNAESLIGRSADLKVNTSVVNTVLAKASQSEVVKAIKDLAQRPIATTAIVDANSFNKANAPYQSAVTANRQNYAERGLATDVKF